MTDKALNVVRELHKKIRDLTSHLQALRLSAQNIVPVIDGLPHSSDVKSRVEKLALKIYEHERELSDLSRQFAISALDLTDRINRADNLNQQEKSILLMRYVACMNFQDIWLELKISDARTFHLHRAAVKKFQAAVKYS